MKGPVMTDAIERAAEAHGPAYAEWNRRFMAGEPVDPAATFVARAALTAALSDREGMARAMHADDLAHGNAPAEWEDMDLDSILWYRRNIDALVAHLLGGEA